MSVDSTNRDRVIWRRDMEVSALEVSGCCCAIRDDYMQQMSKDMLRLLSILR